MNEREVERMVVRLSGDASGYKRMVKEAEDQTKLLGGGLQLASRRVSAFGVTLRGYGALAAAAALPIIGLGSSISNVFKGVHLAAAAEEQEVAFGTMLKSAEKGKALVGMLQDFAARTPLETPDLQAAARMLLQFGVAGNDLLPTLKMLGDVAGGNAEKFKGLALAFGQMKGSGRATNEEINQMIERGFNPLLIVSQQTGKSVGQLRDEVSRGTVPFQTIVNAFQTATKAGGQFEDQMFKQSKTFSGTRSTMNDDVNSMLREFGKATIEVLRLKDGMLLVSQASQEVTKWMGSVSTETKQLVAALAAASAGAIAFAVLWPYVGTTVISWTTAINAAILGLLNPIKLLTVAMRGLMLLASTTATVVTGVVMVLLKNPALLALTVLVSAFIAHAGSLQAAWGRVKESALAAWDWLKPVRQAVVSFFTTAWEIAKEKFEQVRQLLVGVWEEVLEAIGATDFQLETVRDAFRDAVIFMEYTLLHFGQVWDVVWKYAKLQFIVFLDTVIHFFTQTLPYAFEWFSRNWKEVLITFVYNAVVVLTNLQRNFAQFFANVYDMLVEIFQAMAIVAANTVTNIVNVISNLPALVKGNVDLADIWKPVTEGVAFDPEKWKLGRGLTPITKGMTSFIREAFAPPEREIGQLEQRLRAEWEAARDRLMGDFEAFRQQKLAEFAADGLTPQEQQALTDLGKEVGQNFNKGLKQEMDKSEAVLRFSAEAVSRIQAYRERMEAGRPKNFVDSPSRAMFEAKVPDLLEKIHDRLIDIRNKDNVVLEGAGLA